MDRVLKHSANFTVVRTAEPGMVHVHHPIHCAEDIAGDQKIMCDGTRLSFVANKHQMADDVWQNHSVLEYLRYHPRKPVTPVRTKPAAGSAAGH